MRGYREEEKGPLRDRQRWKSNTIKQSLPLHAVIGQYVVVVGLWSTDVSRKTSPCSKMAAHSFL